MLAGRAGFRPRTRERSSSTAMPAKERRVALTQISLPSTMLIFPRRSSISLEIHTALKVRRCFPRQGWICRNLPQVFILHWIQNSFIHAPPMWLIRVVLFIFAFAIYLGQPCNFGCAVYPSVHNSIMLSKSKVTLTLPPSVVKNDSLQKMCLCSLDSILNKFINKNSILSKYSKDCHVLGYSGQYSSTNKMRVSPPPTTYPSIFQLVRDCSMKPDTSYYYWVQDLQFENIIVIIIKPVERYLSDTCIKKLHCLSWFLSKMTNDVCRLQNLNFFKLIEPRIGYADQLNIQASRVDLATTGIISNTPGYYCVPSGYLSSTPVKSLAKAIKWSQESAMQTN